MKRLMTTTKRVRVFDILTFHNNSDEFVDFATILNTCEAKEKKGK